MADRRSGECVPRVGSGFSNNPSLRVLRKSPTTGGSRPSAGSSALSWPEGDDAAISSLEVRHPRSSDVWRDAARRHVRQRPFQATTRRYRLSSSLRRESDDTRHSREISLSTENGPFLPIGDDRTVSAPKLLRRQKLCELLRTVCTDHRSCPHTRVFGAKATTRNWSGYGNWPIPAEDNRRHVQSHPPPRGAPQSWKLLNSKRLEAVRVFGHYALRTRGTVRW
jgi:hypothetical protein